MTAASVEPAAVGPAAPPVVRAEGLRVLLPGRDGRALAAVDGVDLTVQPGEILGIAGESGSGKTMTALALLGLLPHGARTEGTLELNGVDLLRMPIKQLRALRGAQMAMVFQDPMTSLHPMLTVGKQITEHLRFHCRDQQTHCDGPGHRVARAGQDSRSGHGRSRRTRTSSRAACGSAWRSPSHWPARRGC